MSDADLNSSAVGSTALRMALKEIDDSALQALTGEIIDSKAEQLKQKLSLTFSLRELPNEDPKLKKNVYIVLYYFKQIREQTEKIEVGRTECIYDDLNPDFIT